MKMPVKTRDLLAAILAVKEQGIHVLRRYGVPSRHIMVVRLQKQ